MEITFDQAKRDRTLRDRGLDFVDARRVFNGETFTFADERREYGETRLITLGFLAGRMVVIGWVERSGVRHVFSMRKANEREIKTHSQQFAKS
ncbi:MAG: BrnT family toxin [Betaproteobacteria bacterium]|nr:BrnT family toxin [Betaproteobacteria bacterium]